MGIKYRVVRDCVGFQGRYWSMGDIVEVEEGEVVPYHFQAIPSVQAPKAVAKVLAPVAPTQVEVANTEVKPSQPAQPAKPKKVRESKKLYP